MWSSETQCVECDTVVDMVKTLTGMPALNAKNRSWQFAVLKNKIK